MLPSSLSTSIDQEAWSRTLRQNGTQATFFEPTVQSGSLDAEHLGLDFSLDFSLAADEETDTSYTAREEQQVSRTIHESKRHSAVPGERSEQDTIPPARLHSNRARTDFQSVGTAAQITRLPRSQASSSNSALARSTTPSSRSSPIIVVSSPTDRSSVAETIGHQSRASQQVTSDSQQARQTAHIRFPTPQIREQIQNTIQSAGIVGNMIEGDGGEDDQRRGFDQPGDTGPKTSILRARQVEAFTEAKGGLPAEKGFPIQIGSELFRLSGASIMSDAPSYFSRFFEEQMRSNDDGNGSVKTLYIDRDPHTFQDIALHLQGYRILPRDGYHYVKLFADAQFYGLPKLIKQLFESEYFVRIGETDFRIPKDIFSSPGNTPNFFSLGFAMFSPKSGEVFPGLPNKGLFRPPSIESPALLNRSAATFADILHLLRGYPLKVRNPEHRKELLRDCRYYHLRGLEQELIQHSTTFNLSRQKTEMLIRLEDIRQSGVSFVADANPSDRSPLAGWVNYKRPFADENAHELILEMSDESLRLSTSTMRAELFGQSKARITSLFQVVANKMNLQTNMPLGLMMSSGGVDAQPVSPGNTPLSEELVKIAIERGAHVTLDGEEYNVADLPTPVSSNLDDGATPSTTAHSTEGGSMHLHPLSRSQTPNIPQPPRKRQRRGSMEEFGEWIIQKGQWRLRVQPRPEPDPGHGPHMEIIMVAVKLEAVSGQRGRNSSRGFLS